MTGRKCRKFWNQNLIKEACNYIIESVQGQYNPLIFDSIKIYVNIELFKYIGGGYLLLRRKGNILELRKNMELNYSKINPHQVDGQKISK